MAKPTNESRLPVVAIGASAGGLDACRALLREQPADTSAAFILVLHLAPTHESMMVDLLARHTKLKVVQAAEGMQLRQGHLHIIPPGMFLSVTNRVIHLSHPDSGNAVRMPFDVLLQSLAKDAGARAACVVLSGTGTDGTVGLAEIHAAGGLVIVQDPTEAAYAGMPESAIASGLTAQVLTVESMGPAISEFLNRVLSAASDTLPAEEDSRTPDPKDTADFDDLLDFVGGFAQQDISLYKRGTLVRRIARRMALIGLRVDETDRYLDLLRSDATERTHLSADLLIHVTSFFRDPHVFEHLSDHAIPDLLEKASSDQPLRIWVAGCSTGEEAYSLAITCMEAMERTGVQGRLQIFASDLDPEAVATARTGHYANDIATHVSAERLARFFVAVDGGWQVTSSLRDVIVFTVADMLSDPPFSKMDIVSCRNVLIYLGPEAQKRAIARCCFALRRDGLLLLGAAEVPGPADACFALVDKKSRLWRRIGKSPMGDLHFAIDKRNSVQTQEPSSVSPTQLADLCRKIVLEHHAPAAVLMNTRLECLYLLGPTEKYLKISQGHHDQSFVGMLPKALRARFRTAVGSCTAATPLVTVPGMRSAGSKGYDIVLRSVSAGAQPMLLACFVDTLQPDRETTLTAAGDMNDAHTADLEAELASTRGDLLDALRDLELEVEAHGADAAEALSVNEEFQSTNEELLASKEELQSLNEELTALNSQLQETLERHRTTANDLQNVLYSTDVATLFLDRDLKIRFFTPAAHTIFKVIPSDVGRPFTDLAMIARDDDLIHDTRAVLASSKAVERETPGAKEKWFLRRVQPYRAEGDNVEGLVITYVDITDRKRANEALVAATAEAERATKAKSRFLASASHDLRQPLQSIALLHKLLARHRPSIEAKRLTAILDQTLSSMTSMLDSMLDVNRIESGTVRPRMQVVAIGPLMQRLADEFAPQANLKGLRLRYVRCSGWVHTDPQLTEQILRNFLSNALKYTTKGGIVMGCRKRKGHLTIHVVDSGIGVAKTEKHAIFDAYHRVEEHSLLSEPGMGLGLAIVKRLALLMGHEISVRSKSGKGSTFMISLPAVAQPPDTCTSTDIADHSKNVPQRTGTILLVDDEERLRALLSDVLSKAGHKVVSKADSIAAIAWVRENPKAADLLLTDYDMQTGTNGLRLAQDVVTLTDRAIPAIILTGDITTTTLKAIDESAFHQVTKPAAPEFLLAQIAALMNAGHVIRREDVGTTPSSNTCVHVVDDDATVRETMRRLFEAEGWTVRAYSSAEEFLAAPRPHRADCLLVDNGLPGMDGAGLISVLRAEKSQVPMVMLTGQADIAIAVAALRAGASDLIEKPAQAAELLASIRHVINTQLSDRKQQDERSAALAKFFDLTPREHEVLTGVLEGAPNKIIAADLKINQRTVENHRASVMRKTGARSLPALVRLAHVAGFQNT